jgi:hypothetical protein
MGLIDDFEKHKNKKYWVRAHCRAEPAGETRTTQAAG